MDDIDRAFKKWRDGDSLSSNEQHALEKLSKEHGTDRASDYEAIKKGNKK